MFRGELAGGRAVIGCLIVSKSYTHYYPTVLTAM